MTARMTCGLTVSLLTTVVLWSGRGYAAEVPQLALQVRAVQFAGPVADGTLLVQGSVNSGEPHTGFRVWSEAAQNGAPQRYILTGRGSHNHRIRVRLVGRDWQPDVMTGRGMVLMSSDYGAPFSVELDGDQMLPADTWPLQLQAVTLLP